MDASAVLKDVELQAHYDLLFKLFADPAWKRFVEEAQRFAGGVNDIRRLKNEHGLGFAQGQLDVLTWIVGFEDMTTKTYELLRADDNPTAAMLAGDADDLL